MAHGPQAPPTRQEVNSSPSLPTLTPQPPSLFLCSWVQSMRTPSKMKFLLLSFLQLPSAVNSLKPFLTLPPTFSFFNAWFRSSLSPIWINEDVFWLSTANWPIFLLKNLCHLKLGMMKSFEDSSDGCTIVWMHQMPLNCTFLFIIFLFNYFAGTSKE